MKHCTQCEKMSVMGGKRNLLRGHYNPTPKVRKYPNLQYSIIDGKRELICTRCIRTNAKGARVRITNAAGKKAKAKATA